MGFPKNEVIQLGCEFDSTVPRIKTEHEVSSKNRSLAHLTLNELSPQDYPTVNMYKSLPTHLPARFFRPSLSPSPSQDVRTTTLHYPNIIDDMSSARLWIDPCQLVPSAFPVSFYEAMPELCTVNVVTTDIPEQTLPSESISTKPSNSESLTTDTEDSLEADLKKYK